MAVAYKVAGNSPTYHHRRPKLKPVATHWWVNGCWPYYRVNDQAQQWLTFWGRGALMSWLVVQRMSKDVVIHDRRKLWK